MPKITALIHTYSSKDGSRLSRALESLRPCDQVLIINHPGDEDVLRAGRDYGAEVKAGIPGVAPGAYLVDAAHDWILCLLPTEALSEECETTLFQWKDIDHDPAAAYAAAIREETANGWRHLPPETRLVNRNSINWTGDLPANNPRAELLSGDILRFCLP